MPVAGITPYFRSGRDPDLVGYTTTDFVQGTGMVRFYGGGTQDSSGIKYRLSTETFETSISDGASPPVAQRYLIVTISGSSFSKHIDLDFDTGTFNRNTVIEGKMLSCIPFGITNTNPVGGDVGHAYVIVDLKKVATDGTTETSLVSVQSNTVYQASNDYADNFFSVISTVPRTNLLKGEKLRITVEGWAKTTAGSPRLSIVFDPKNRAIALPTYYPDFTAGYTQMTFDVPFKILY